MNYKISIIIPVYNVEKFLNKSFGSLKRQTIGFENLQIIFADDCSTDGSRDIIRGFAAEYTNVESVCLPQNSGAAGAPRNAALDKAEAKYFMCFDPDDELTEDACRVLYDAIERTDADFAFGYHSEVNAAGTCLSEKPQRYDGFAEKTYIFPEDLPIFVPQGAHFAAKIYTTEFYREKKLSFPVGIPGQDTVFFMNYLFESKMATYVNECIYRYTIHPGSISFSHTKKYFVGLSHCYALCYKLFEKYGLISYSGKFNSNNLSFYINKMFESALTDDETMETLEAVNWLWERCAENGADYGSEYANIMGSVFSSDMRIAVYDNLKKLRLYALELESAKGWFSGQIESRDRHIEEKDKYMAELLDSKAWFLDQIEEKDRQLEDRDKQIEDKDKYIAELLDAKVWFLEQIENKDRLLEEKDRQLEDMDKQIEEKDKLLNKKLVRAALKLNSL